MAIPRRTLGKTGIQVSALGLGGFHIGKPSADAEAIRIIHAAIDAGISFMDNAWEYHEGLSEERMGQALQGRRDDVFLMTKVCTHGRGRHVAMQQLEESLRRLRTDHLDLWQIHEVVYANDPDWHFAPGGAIEALDQARREGKVRFVGFTGHKDPSIHLDMLARGFDFDTCQLPLNCFDAHFRSFETLVLPELARRDIAPIGMKSMGGDGSVVTRGRVRPEDALRYAMSLPVAVTVSGIDSLDVLQQNVAVANDFEPLAPPELQQLRASVAERAADGRLELYKTSMMHDGPIGREQHGFPSQQELAL
jgi:aryl-alcohol dehydrogenase-like predicted oxidoreductase